MFLLVLTHLGCPGQNPESRKMFVCVCVCVCVCGWIFSSKCGFDRLALLVHRGAVYRSTGVCVTRHNFGIKAKQVEMIWASAAKRRQLLGEEMYGV